MLETLSRRLIAIGLVLACVAGGAQEPQQGALEVQTVVQKIVETVDADTGEVTTDLASVATALPGDEVVYTVTFRNVGEHNAENIQITNPIPTQMRYVDGTAFGPGASVVYSIDGGTTYALPDDLRVVENDGEDRPAQPDDYTHIRWALNVPLAAGESSFARFHAVVR